MERSCGTRRSFEHCQSHICHSISAGAWCCSPSLDAVPGHASANPPCTEVRFSSLFRSPQPHLLFVRAPCVSSNDSTAEPVLVRRFHLLISSFFLQLPASLLAVPFQYAAGQPVTFSITAFNQPSCFLICSPRCCSQRLFSVGCWLLDRPQP
jgi:hypothetical protein